MADITAPIPLLREAFRPRLLQLLLVMAAIGLALVAARALIAQVEGDRGISAVVSSTDIEVADIEVDVRGKNAKDAREAGWQEAQRKAWEKIDGPTLSDSQLQGLVSSIVIQRERVGPRRYIATLGVIFDRTRAERYLGGDGTTVKSAPMLLLPVTITGGSAQIYERRGPWQRAWAEYQAGASRIAYVRPSGAGNDSLLLTYGQTGRRSRLWWRNILDEFQATDVLVAIARLDYRFPGGPVDARFTARHGPDNTYLESFSMTARNDADLPRMMAAAVRRFDTIFAQALSDDKLKPDPTLNFTAGGLDPALQRLIDIGRAADAQDRADRAARERSERSELREAAPVVAEPVETLAPVATTSVVVQFASADASAIDATLAAVRATPGVRGAATTSLAIGGTSVMSVTYAGNIGELAGALRGRGFTVTQGNNALAIRR